MELRREVEDSPAMRRIPSVADDNGGAALLSLVIGVNLLWGARILHQSVQFTTNAPAFGCNFFACLLPEHDHKTNEFKRFE